MRFKGMFGKEDRDYERGKLKKYAGKQDISALIAGKPVPQQRHRRGRNGKRRKPDIALAQELLGWSPEVPLREGLARTIAYFSTLK